MAQVAVLYETTTGQYTAGPIPSGAITAGSVRSAEIGSGQVGPHVANQAIQSAHLASGQGHQFFPENQGIRSAHLGSGQMGGFHFAAGEVLSGALGSGQGHEFFMGNQVLTSAHYASGGIGGYHTSQQVLVPQPKIFTNNTDSNSVQALIIEGDRATPTDGDSAYVSLRLSDSAGNQDEQARISWAATTVLHGATQDGDLFLSVLVNNVLTEFLRLDGSASQILASKSIDMGSQPALNVGGVWTLGATWTIPAFTLGGSVTGGANTMTGMGSINGLVITADTGAITTGTWTASAVGPAYGGTGVANNVASTLTISGNFATTLTISGITSVTLPTTGTLATLAGIEELTNKTITAPDINGGTADSLTSLSIRSTGAAFDLTLATSTVFSAGRTLTILPGDSARTITLSGNPTLADWFDQAVKTTSNPTFGNLTITSFAANWTNAGRTVADLGIVTTVDINGGSVDGATIGAASATTGVFTTLTAQTVGIAGTGEAGVTAATGTTFRAPNVATGGAGNVAGADLTIAAGLGTGTGDEGTIIFSLPIQAVAGDNIQTTAARMTLDMAGSATVLTVSFAQAATISTATGALGLTSTDAAVNIVTGSGAADDFTVNTTQFVVEGDTGFVGVGTAGPSEILELRRSADGDGVVIAIVNTAATDSTDETVELRFALANNLDRTAAIVAAREGAFSSAGTANSSLRFLNAVAGVPTEHVRITQLGALVIGTGEAGVTAATGNTLRAPNSTTGGAGNIAGADLTIGAGLGTGTGDEGTIIFQLPIQAAAGDNIQTTATRLTLDMAGSATVLTMSFAGATTITAGGTLTLPAFTLAGTLSGATNITMSASAGNDVLIGDDVTILYVDGGVGAAAVGTTAYTAQPAGSLGVAAGVMIGSDTLNSLLDDAAGGAGSTTMYIGTTAIQMVSDVRVKKDIEQFSGSALDLLRQARVVTFGWDDPSDTTEWGKNSRGKYVGMLAQETIEWAPWAINTGSGRYCPRCRAGIQCAEHMIWQAEYEHLVPLVIKGIQEIDALVTTVELGWIQVSKRIESLEEQAERLERENADLKERIVALEPA